MAEPVAFKVGELVEVRGVDLGVGRIAAVTLDGKKPFDVRWDDGTAGVTLSFPACSLRRIHAPRKT